MNLIRLIEVHPYRWLISSYIVFCFLVSIFVSIHSSYGFFVSIILGFLYNFFFFVIVFSIFLLIDLKIMTQQKMKYFIYFSILILITLFGKLYKIDEKFYQSLTSISTMQQNLKSGHFKFIGKESKVKVGRVKDLMTSNIPFALDEQNETVTLSCQLFSNDCTDVARGSFYNHRNFVEYYDQGSNNYLIFKATSEQGKIVDYTEQYINTIKLQQALVVSYLISVLFMFFHVFYIFRRMNSN